MPDIPILNWQDYQVNRDPDRFARQLGQAFRETGFALLTDHGVPAALINETFRQADRFFDLPVAEKANLDIAKTGNNRGWARLGSERLDETSGQIDAKEAFNVGLELEPDDPALAEPFRGLNIWPELTEFCETLLQYYKVLWQLGVNLHEPIAQDLKLPRHHFAAHFSKPMATLRLLHYPPATGHAGEIGAGAHTDYGSITLLMTDGEPGLQVRPKGGDWLDVPHVKGAFVVNIGDCLMRWTNDTYISTPHRVLPPKRRRRSIAFFLDPNPDALIEALPGTGSAKYETITGADYLCSRLDATYKPGN